MKNEKLSTDQRVAKELIEKHPGDNGAAIMWRYLGGQFANGVAVGRVSVSPAQLIKAVKLPTRASEAAKISAVVKREGALNRITGTSDMGYWPSGCKAYVASSRVGVPVNAGVVRASGEPERSSVVDGVGMASNIADLSSVLTDE